MADKKDAFELKEAEEHWEEIMERVEAGEEIVLMRRMIISLDQNSNPYKTLNNVILHT
jgi:hypothetical protein